MNSLETVLRQRAYDGMIEKVIRVKDHENSYTYTTDTGYKVTYTPEKWLTVGVYDMEIEIGR